MWRTHKFVPMIILGAGIFFVMAAAFLWPQDIIELKFDTYQQALKAGAIENEWLPGFLPESAKNVRSTSNLDSNTELVSFNFGSDFDEFIAAQQTAKPETASSLGLRGQSEAFADSRELIYIPRIVLSGEPYPGALLINRIRRTILYIK